MQPPALLQWVARCRRGRRIASWVTTCESANEKVEQTQGGAGNHYPHEVIAPRHAKSISRPQSRSRNLCARCSGANDSNVVLHKRLVSANQGHAFGLRLGDQHAVERVAVMER